MIGIVLHFCTRSDLLSSVTCIQTEKVFHFQSQLDMTFVIVLKYAVVSKSSEPLQKFSLNKMMVELVYMILLFTSGQSQL